MHNYVICTDSACDIHSDILRTWGVPYISLTFHFEDEDREYSNNEIPVREFYARMRQGGIAKTSAVNVGSFRSFFEEYLRQGQDVLYLGFSSGLSTTYNSARLAADELACEYPQNRVITVDTLCASAGQGLLLYLTLKEKEAGASLTEAAAFAEAHKLNLCHWFTVDDLVYLKRGGRVSAAVALMGTVLGIKPVLHVDNDGHLISKGKVRGRKASLHALAEKYGQLALDPAGGTAFICQADCMEDAELLKGILKENYGAEVEIITDVGTVIGAHSGPGTIALFFLGSER